MPGGAGNPPFPAGRGVHPCCGDTIPNSKSLPIQDEAIEERCWEGGALSEDGGRKVPVAPVGDRQSICSWEQVVDKTSHPVEQLAH